MDKAMNCKECGSKIKKFGRDRHGSQRYRCTKCGKTYLDARKRLVKKMTVPEDKLLLCLQLLCEGSSIRAAARVSGVYRNTIIKLLRIVGLNCEQFTSNHIQGLSVDDVQADEIWSFIGRKQKTKVRAGKKKDYSQGDAYTFTAIERHTKLILCWHLGRRTAPDTHQFMEKLERATTGHFQLTTDGYLPYRDAVSFTVGARVDFAQLVKIYRATREGQQRYSPSEITEVIPIPVYGNPDKNKICTSHVERQNLTMRMSMRRMTRLTNAFSKKWIMFKAALGLYFAHYNFCRVHQTLKVTPAMEAGLTDHVWSLRELVDAASLS